MCYMNVRQQAEYLTALASIAETERLAIWDERLYMTRSFYQLNRKLQKYGHLRQPAFLQLVVGPLLTSKKMVFTNEGLIDAVDLWCSKYKAVAKTRYVHILAWNTSQVANVGNLFQSKHVFNGDLSRWDTSNVTTMEGMFCNAYAFNGDLSRWDTSKVTTMRSMFNTSHAFNGDLSRWDASNVTTMTSMFNTAHAFNGDISRWDRSRNTPLHCAVTAW